VNMPAAVRGTSAGKLKNGGRARIAVIETAPAIPAAGLLARDKARRIRLARLTVHKSGLL